MPWKPKDAPHKTKKASTPKKKELWSEIANRLLKGGASDESAIRQANAVVGGTAKHKR
jgi:uncharacterized protein YdaT